MKGKGKTPEKETVKKRSVTIAQIPPGERPYEKCLRAGPGVLTDQELLAVIIRSGAAGLSSVDLAGEILAAGKSKEGLLSIPHLSVAQLMQIRGVGKAKAVQIRCIGELSKRIAAQAARPRISFCDPESVAAYYMEQLRHEEQESLICMMFNTKGEFIGEEVIARGTVNQSYASPREVIMAAFRCRAVSIILVHNHPSGDPTPSAADESLTRRMRDACELVGIALLDHVIIGDLTYTSFKIRELARQSARRAGDEG